MNKPTKEYAFFSGFCGQRGEQTWRARMRQLAMFGFIETEKGPHGELSYILIMNPIPVIESLAQKKTPGLRKDYVNTLFERSGQVMARNLDEVVPKSK